MTDPMNELADKLRAEKIALVEQYHEVEQKSLTEEAMMRHWQKANIGGLAYQAWQRAGELAVQRDLISHEIAVLAEREKWARVFADRDASGMEKLTEMRHQFARELEKAKP